MPKREDVIRGLERCGKARDHDGCPYDGDEDREKCAGRLMADAKELLKRRETKKVNIVCRHNNCLSSGLCPTCGKVLNTNTNRNYCGECGQEVTWD